MAVSMRLSSTVSTVRAGVARPALPVRKTARAVSVRAQAEQKDAAFEVSKTLALATVASNWMFAGNAHAATEIAQLAASDNRLGLITALFVPALGWVAFNILQPALNQLDKMNDAAASANPSVSKKRSISAAIGLGAAATMLLAQQADAATELSQLAESDNRLGIIATLFVPALGWVAFNILQPALNQLDKMNDAAARADPSVGKKKRSVSAAVGLGAAATMLMAQQADAATELAQLAESDNRLGIIATLFVPALGWVAFNILQPALNQLDKMNDAAARADPSVGKKKRSISAVVGLGAAASMLMAQQADAATELAQLAESDNRLGIIATLFVPALGWVAFNILQPALNQLDKMNDAAARADPSVGKKKRSVSAVVGLGAAASMLLAQQADAATELAQLAESDNRLGIIATLFVPALGWVAFNILQPALNQLDKMNDAAARADPSVGKKAGRR